MKTKLINIADCDAGDFGVDHLEYMMLQRADDCNTEVTVIACSVDRTTGNKRDNYYDIVLPNGLKVDAISGYYLQDIHKFGHSARKAIFSVELDVTGPHDPNRTLDYERMIPFITSGLTIAAASSAWRAGFDIAVGTVLFETELPG